MVAAVVAVRGGHEHVSSPGSDVTRHNRRKNQNKGAELLSKIRTAAAARGERREP